jgi:hypothetical protein
MKRDLVLAAGLVFALGACAQTQSQTSAAPAAAALQAAPATPSPRAECAPAHVTLYFGEQVASDEPVVTPLLNDFMNQVRACQAAGGELRSITIATTADPGQSASEARAQVRRRVERVRAALVNVGAPADKVMEGPPAPAEYVMGRRAEITADLY